MTVTAVPRQVDRAYGAYIFDLDGTVYLGDEPLPGAVDLLRRLREQGRRTVFLSNNPTRDPQMYVAKLRRMGIEAGPDDVLNPLVTLTRWLHAEAPGARLFVIGEEPLLRAVHEAGFTTTSRAEEVDVVVASYDRGFDYAKLQVAFDALWQHRRARLVTTNPDAYCPMPGGRGEPDAAAVVAAIEASTGVRCEVNLGKPGPFMLRTALDLAGVGPQDCLMVGDRLYTDVAMAVDAGLDSAVVLTGETTQEMLASTPADRRPTYVLHRIDEILAGLGQAGP